MSNGIHHCGLTVGDLDLAIEFYVDLLHAKVLSRKEGIASEHTSAALGLDRVRLNSVMLAFPGGGLLSLVKYDEPAGRVLESRTYDVGSAHLSYLVRDVRDIYSRLEEKGAAVTSDPKCLNLTNSSGEYITMFARDRDGTHLQFMQAVNG